MTKALTTAVLMIMDSFVMCKVYSYASIENKLNGIDTSDTDNLKRETLTLNQKLSLEQGLKEILPTKIQQYHTPMREMRPDSNVNTIPFYTMTSAIPIVNGGRSSHFHHHQNYSSYQGGI